MTWEEDMIVERLLRLFRPRDDVQQDNEAQRIRSDRMRYFLNVFGSRHWADRVDGRRVPFARQGHIAL